MASVRFRCAGIVLALMTMATPSFAGVVDVVRDWNLLGTWATDCSKPPAPQNPYATYVQREYTVFLDRDVGRNRDSLAIVDASAQHDGTIAIVIAFERPRQQRTNVLAKSADGRIRAMSNHDGKGQYSVRDGVMLGLKQPTPWQQRCA